MVFNLCVGVACFFWGGESVLLEREGCKNMTINQKIKTSPPRLPLLCTPPGAPLTHFRLARGETGGATARPV